MTDTGTGTLTARTEWPPSRLELLALAALVAAAFGLRAWGAGFGLPFTYHPDEHQYVDTAVAVLNGQLDPVRFNNPTLVKYVLAVADAGWIAAARIGGGASSAASFTAQFAADPSTAYLLARLLVALLGAATVAVVWALGRSAGGPGVAWPAAALMGVAFLHVRESHFAVSDVPATLLVATGLLLAVRIQRGAPLRDYALAGALVGLAAAAKYSGVLVAVAVVSAHLLAEGAPLWQAPRRLADRRLWLAGAVAVAAFVVAVPYAVLRWPAFSADVALLLERGRQGFKGVALADQPGWRFYLSTLDWGMGWPFLAVSAAAVPVGLVRGRSDRVLALFTVVAYLYLSRQLLLFERFLLPVLPALVVLAASALAGLARRTLGQGRARQPAMVLATAALCALPLASSLRFDWLLGRADTRTLAKEWIEANVPAGARLTVQSNGPELSGNGSSAPMSLRTFDLEVVGTTDLPDRPLTDFGRRGQEFVVTSSFSTDRRMLDPAADARRQSYFAELDARFQRLAVFRPYAGPDPGPFLFAEVYGPAVHLWARERPGPTVIVYRVDAAATRKGP
jgi:hypothetical protein